MNRISAGMLLFVAMAVPAGCHSETPVSVTGTVTLGGAPLDNGTISFVPNSGGQQSAGWSTVTDGKYSIASGSGLSDGDYRVEIRAMKAMATQPTSDELPIPAQELVPVRYNSKSELKAQLKLGENTVNFDLKAK